MTESNAPRLNSLIPQPPVHEEAEVFSRRMGGLMDGQPKDDATVSQALSGMDEMLDVIAAGLYNLASMLVGEGEEGVQLVETAVADAEVSACHDPLTGRQSSRRALCRAAVAMLAQRDPECLAAPAGEPARGSCIEDDELESAGVSRQQLEDMIAGPDRGRVRQWLAKLPVSVRTVFVLRAVAGISTDETAAILAERGGPRAAGWQPDAVREVFRQGLCSLASQLFHAASTRES
jgi:hypothetical protein